VSKSAEAADIKGYPAAAAAKASAAVAGGHSIAGINTTLSQIVLQISPSTLMLLQLLLLTGPAFKVKPPMQLQLLPTLLPVLLQMWLQCSVSGKDGTRNLW
jgi:hypothetical protein